MGPQRTREHSEAMLCLVRHGAAGEAARDQDRKLTAVGRSEVDALGRALEAKGVRVDRILHSTLERARETAEILALRLSANAASHDGLTPGDDPDIFVAELEELGGSTLIVSHLPFLPNLCEELLEEVSAMPQFQTATAACLAPVGTGRGHHAWRLQWQINGRSELMRRE